MPIRTIDEFHAAQEYFDDPATPPDAKEKLRASMSAFSSAQSGQVDLSSLQADRDAIDSDTVPTSGGNISIPELKQHGPRVGAVGVPSHIGIPGLHGSVQQRIDPSFNEFVRQNDAALGSLPPEARASIMSNGVNSPEYKNWAQQQWEQVASEAERTGTPTERIPAETFANYEPDAGIGARLGKLSANALDSGLALAGGALDSGLLAVPGAGTAIAAGSEKLGITDPDSANQFRQRQERHPIAATIGAGIGAASPQNLVGLAARGGYGALTRAAGYIAPKVSGLAALAGRTLGSGLVGGGTAVAEGATRDAVNQAAFNEAPTPGLGIRRLAEGAALGAGANLIGEGLGAVSDATRAAHPEIAAAEENGVRPGLLSMQATGASPARTLELQRAAQGDETLVNTASKNAAPLVANAASEQNKAMLAQSAAETAAIHDELSTAGPLVAPVRPRGEAKNERLTLPPGPGDAEADTFGRLARERGENQASLLGIEQAVKGGPRSTPIPEATGPQLVSTAPVAEEVINILERHTGPRGRELPFFGDDDLRRQLPKMFDVQVLPVEDAAALAAKDGGWVQPLDRLVQTGILPGAVPGSEGKVGYLKPVELDSRQYDELVQQLQTKAKLDTNLQPDPRYGQLAAAATKARGEFPGLNELNTKQATRFDAYRERAEGAALRVGKNKEVLPYDATPHSDKAALLNALDQYKAAGRTTGAQARDQHFEAIARASDQETRDALRSIPMARSVEELRTSMHLSSPLAVGGKQRILGAGLVRLNPTLKALGSVPDVTANMNPKLRELLQRMRVKSAPSGVGVAALSGRIGMRGGVNAARAEQTADEYRADDPLTREDLENLLRLKRATQKANP